MSVTGEPGGAPVKCGVPVSDFCAGLYAAYAIAAVLMRVRNGGAGEYIDVSMLGASLGIAALQTSEYFGTGRDPAKLGSAHPRNAPYQAFQAKDGYFAMAAGNDGLWRTTCEALARTDLAADPRFATTALRAQHQAVLKDALEGQFATCTVQQMLERLRTAGVPCAPINTYASALADEQVAHMQWVQQITLPSGAHTRTFSSPLRFSGQGFPVRRDPPALGQHNDEILTPSRSLAIAR